MLVLEIALDDSDQFFVTVKGKDLLSVKSNLFFHVKFDGCESNGCSLGGWEE